MPFLWWKSGTPCPVYGCTGCPHRKPICSTHEKLIQVNPGERCPQYACKPPSECIYEHKYWLDEDKFERSFENDTKKELYPIGGKWLDGLCRSCKCLEDSDGFPHYQCVQTECSRNTHFDNDQYEEKRVPNECCPVIKKIACKDNGVIIKVGDNKTERCRSVECVKTEEGKVKERVTIQHCNESCPEGYHYQPPPQNTNQCCGQCKQVGCPWKNETIPVGKIWSSDDNCTTYKCIKNSNDVPTLVVDHKECPHFNPECPAEDIYQDDSGCCSYCGQKQRVCVPEEMPPQDTVGIFKKFNPESGKCKNNFAVEKFMQCYGQCNSSTSYQGEEAMHVSTCKCCKPSAFIKISVELQCEFGKNITYKYDNIKECECQLCDNSAGLKPIEFPPK
uniref:Hemolectin n=1 Tax=Procambarus clarkii TaxID=6728 RepID=A0A8B0M633_PROCL|nr:hemolectin [Procambarus clarkii]